MFTRDKGEILKKRKPRANLKGLSFFFLFLVKLLKIIKHEWSKEFLRFHFTPVHIKSRLTKLILVFLCLCMNDNNNNNTSGRLIPER